MSYFDADYIDFFTELAFNNEKSWFDTNRKRYGTSVREPFKAFTVDMIEGIRGFDPEVGQLQPKDVMFRINRDLRFSKDKTPYNTWLSAFIAPGGKKRGDEFAGYYFRFAVDGVSLGVGMYAPNKEKLCAIREKIARDPQALKKIIKKPALAGQWGELVGDENKIVPQPFKEQAKTEPLLKKKGFSLLQEHPEQEVLREDLREWMLESYKITVPLIRYLNEA